MKIRIGVPRKDPKVSVEADISEQQIMGGLAKVGQFIKSKLPFKIEVDKDASTHQD
jgi:hypothetical protein